MTIGDLFSGWTQDDAELFTAQVKTGIYSSVDVSEACQQAVDQLDRYSENHKGYFIPLFLEHSPKPSNEYVIYRPNTDEIGWRDTRLGGKFERFASCDRLGTTIIGQRLRFWLPANQPQTSQNIDDSKLPAERVTPTDRLSDPEQKEFFGELKQFVRSERDAERRTNWETYDDTDLAEAIRRNQMSGPFVHIHQSNGSDGKRAYVYQLAEDEDSNENVDLRGDEGLFNGNLCIVDTESEESELPIEVELLSVDDPKIKIQPRWDAVESEKAVHAVLNGGADEIWLHDLLNPVPYERRLSAIRQVERDDAKRDLLTGQRSVGFAVNKFALPDSGIELNEHQQLAMIWADGAQDIVCIHGPPGTGKTRTLTAYVRHAVSSGQSVLVTAHSNQAVDNLLVGDSTRQSPEKDTLHAMAQDPETNLSIARVGANSRNAVVQANYLDKSTQQADVVAATTSGAAQFDPDTFDVAVVDEATQASRPATAIVLNCARKLVLAGDHKQLPPYCADESMQEEDMHISLFEYLLTRYGDEISVLLRTQYRMNEEIAEFPNQSFYNGSLETADQNRRWTVDDLKPLMGIQIHGDEQRQVHGKSYYNIPEAEAVAKQVKLLVQSGLDPEDIGVITAYSGQIGQIGSRVNSLDIEGARKVSIDTVDSFQGSEREAIIVSFVRCNESGNSGFLEFPEEGPRRLNVALTRARKRLVLIGDWNTLSSVAPHRTSDESCAALYERLESHIRDNNWMLSG